MLTLAFPSSSTTSASSQQLTGDCTPLSQQIENHPSTYCLPPSQTRSDPSPKEHPEPRVRPAYWHTPSGTFVDESASQTAPARHLTSSLILAQPTTPPLTADQAQPIFEDVYQDYLSMPGPREQSSSSEDESRSTEEADGLCSHSCSLHHPPLHPVNSKTAAKKKSAAGENSTPEAKPAKRAKTETAASKNDLELKQLLTRLLDSNKTSKAKTSPPPPSKAKSNPATPGSPGVSDKTLRKQRANLDSALNNLDPKKALAVYKAVQQLVKNH